LATVATSARSSTCRFESGPVLGGAGAAGVVVPRSPWLPARVPMPALLPLPVAPIAASAMTARAGAQSIPAATAIARRLIAGRCRKAGVAIWGRPSAGAPVCALIDNLLF
jgi:hypothetical protein